MPAPLDLDDPEPTPPTRWSPGSPEAVALGCACAVLDNARGRGIPGPDGTTCYWITGGCPLHDQPDRTTPVPDVPDPTAQASLDTC